MKQTEQRTTKLRLGCYVLSDILWEETEVTGQASLVCVMIVGMNYCNDPIWL